MRTAFFFVFVLHPKHELLKVFTVLIKSKSIKFFENIQPVK